MIEPWNQGMKLHFGWQNKFYFKNWDILTGVLYYDYTCAHINEQMALKPNFKLFEVYSSSTCYIIGIKIREKVQFILTP